MDRKASNKTPKKPARVPSLDPRRMPIGAPSMQPPSPTKRQDRARTQASNPSSRNSSAQPNVRVGSSALQARNPSSQASRSNSRLSSIALPPPSTAAKGSSSKLARTASQKSLRNSSLAVLMASPFPPSEATRAVSDTVPALLDTHGNDDNLENDDNNEIGNDDDDDIGTNEDTLNDDVAEDTVLITEKSTKDSNTIPNGPLLTIFDDVAKDNSTIDPALSQPVSPSNPSFLLYKEPTANSSHNQQNPFYTSTPKKDGENKEESTEEEIKGQADEDIENSNAEETEGDDQGLTEEKEEDKTTGEIADDIEDEKAEGEDQLEDNAEGEGKPDEETLNGDDDSIPPPPPPASTPGPAAQSGSTSNAMPTPTPEEPAAQSSSTTNSLDVLQRNLPVEVIDAIGDRAVGNVLITFEQGGFRQTVRWESEEVLLAQLARRRSA